jgi:F-type H+-transporting ATPase subunit a
MASAGLVEVVNWYHVVVSTALGENVGARWWPVLASVFVLALVLVVGIVAGLYRLKPEAMSDEELLPPESFGVRAFLELVWAVISSTLAMVIGEKKWERFAPVLGGTFVFILFCNLTGIVPGFTPATEQMNMTLAMGLFVFAFFNYYGLKVAGIAYVKHLAGPVLALAPLIFVIELISTCVRPLSLGLRLFGNISGDHLVFSAFSTLQRVFHVPWFPMPAALLVFGVFVACLQAFIFMTLSAVYVKLAIETAHDEHLGEHGH